MEKEINLFMKNLRNSACFSDVKFVILFGSQVNGKANKLSDYDFAVYFDACSKERFSFRIKISAELPNNFDVHIFQDLPLYIRKEIFKGNLIYAKDLRFVYDVAYQTIKDFEDFKKVYYDYIGLEKIK